MSKKLKTNKWFWKRVKITKNNKIMHSKCWKSHLLTNKNDAHKKDKYGRRLPAWTERKANYLIPYRLR